MEEPSGEHLALSYTHGKGTQNQYDTLSGERKKHIKGLIKEYGEVIRQLSVLGLEEGIRNQHKSSCTSSGADGTISILSTPLTVPDQFSHPSIGIESGIQQGLGDNNAEIEMHPDADFDQNDDRDFEARD